MDVEVHCLSGKQYKFKIDAVKQVYHIKKQICELANRSYDSQALLLAGEELSDSSVLASLGSDALSLEVLFVDPEVSRKERVSKFLVDRENRDLPARVSQQDSDTLTRGSQEDKADDRLAAVIPLPMEVVRHDVADFFGAFDVPPQYSDLKGLHRGVNGDVCAAEDVQSGEKVAIKKCCDVFQDLVTAKRTLREVRLLRHLQHENIARVMQVFFPGVKESFDHVYIVEEFMDVSLDDVIKDKATVLSNEHCQFFLYQILRGLKFVHSAGVIHRDLKPCNILVRSSTCDLAICDFGLARVHLVKDESQGWLGYYGAMTENVATRWYRAPELMWGCHTYGKAIDLWAVGCIFAALFRGKPLFAGFTTQHQLHLILNCLGAPEDDVLQGMTKLTVKAYIQHLIVTQDPLIEQPISQLVLGAPAEALDLLARTLQLNPRSRSTAENLLGHPYLEHLSCIEDEPVRLPLDITEFEFEHQELDEHMLRDEIASEVLHYCMETR